MKKLILLIFCVFALLQNAHSFEYDDTQAWSFVKVKGDFDNPYFPEFLRGKLVTNFEFHYRLKEEFSKFQTMILRPSVGYKLPGGVTVWIGYAYAEAGKDDGTQGEIRFFQMVSFKQGLGKTPLVFFSKTRLEQRMFEGLPDTTLRFRQMVMLSLKIFNTKNAKVTFFGKYEYFQNLTHADPAKVAGYDQQRTLIGLGYKTDIRGREVEFSAGYMHNHNNKDQYDQGINFGVSISLSKRDKRREDAKRSLERSQRRQLEE